MSLSAKTEKWLARECDITLAGKTVAVTGANSGVGFKIAETALYLGAKVVLACRNAEKAESAREKLLADCPGADIRVLQLDLADLSSVDSFAETVVKEAIDIDVFVNNAGVIKRPGDKTADGLDLVIGTNYIGVYYLTKKLVPYLKTLPHEVFYINTGSIIYKVAGIDYGDFYCAGKRSRVAAYGRSKICLTVWTRALARECEGTNLRVYLNHPGISITPLARGVYGGIVPRLAGLLHGCFNSPEKSALSVACILAKRPPAGSVVGPDRLFGGWGYPKVNRVKKKADLGAEELEAFTDAELAKLGR